MELFEDRQKAHYEVRPVYLEVRLLILAHDAAQSRVVPHHVEHGQRENSEERGHTLQLESDGVHFIHWIDEADILAAVCQLLQHLVQLFRGHCFSLLLG